MFEASTTSLLSNHQPPSFACVISDNSLATLTDHHSRAVLTCTPVTSGLLPLHIPRRSMLCLYSKDGLLQP